MRLLPSCCGFVVGVQRGADGERLDLKCLNEAMRLSPRHYVTGGATTATPASTCSRFPWGKGRLLLEYHKEFQISRGKVNGGYIQRGPIPMSTRKIRVRSKLRLLILERDGFTCRDCRRKKWIRRRRQGHFGGPRRWEFSGNWSPFRWLEIHHRDGDHTNQVRQNLVALCISCHRYYTNQTGCAKACGKGHRYWDHDDLCTCIPSNRGRFSLLPNGKRVRKGAFGSRLYSHVEEVHPIYQSWLLRTWNPKADPRKCLAEHLAQREKKENDLRLRICPHCGCSRAVKRCPECGFRR